jgi:aminoglycoside phosphotransferase
MKPLRHGYTNDTRGDGSVVVKRYSGPEWSTRLATERQVLSHLNGGLLAPRLIESATDALTLAHVPGVQGQDLIHAGYAPDVLRSCGEMLRRIQAFDVTAVFPDAPAGTVLVHGDFGPNNMLFDPGTFAATAVLDWEWAHPGDPIDDLAWCEWIVRTHHPAEVEALRALFAAYGSRPAWAERQRAALAKCRKMLALPRPEGDAGPGAQRWRKLLADTASWTA